MLQLVLKVLITAIVVVAVSEIAKRSTFWAGVLASLPLTSLLAFVWIHLESGSAERVAALSQTILWLVPPSLVLFALMPVLLRAGVGFWPALAVACVATAVAYFGMVQVLARFGLRM
jgi:hypothetical protein